MVTVSDLEKRLDSILNPKQACVCSPLATNALANWFTAAEPLLFCDTFGSPGRAVTKWGVGMLSQALRGALLYAEQKERLPPHTAEWVVHNLLSLLEARCTGPEEESLRELARRVAVLATRDT